MDRKILLYALNILMLLLCACGNEGSLSSHIDADGENSSEVELAKDSLHKEMIRVKANGAHTFLGSDFKFAKSNEKPVMRVMFDYDFSIGSHEVTCGEFGDKECSSDDVPVSNVTFYDAVLFANARSKKEGFDTAYVYTKKVVDDKGHCIGMENLEFKANVNAYRLPTEAEWVLVANQNWNPQESWNSTNSDFKKNKVCSIESAKDIVCDMAGNVAEWVNDWMGYLADTTITNFIGSVPKGTQGERIVKGGSYRNNPQDMYVYTRGDIYTVVSSTKADYVGFRLAFGAIPHAKTLDVDRVLSSGDNFLKATLEAMKKVTGSYLTKLAFRDDITGNLTFVDYSDGFFDFTIISDTIDVYHPDISPDGKLVAFCTKQEGVSGVSRLYVRNLNATGSNLVQLNVESAAIPRWRILENGDTVIVYVSDAGVNSDEAKWLEKSTWQVKFSNGKFGTPEKLFDGSFHGGISEDGLLAVSGARLLRSRIYDDSAKSYSNGLWYNSEQACNASLSHDGTKRTLFLDFGGKTGHEFVGNSYGTHKYLLFADSMGQLIKAIPSPKDYSFDHSEWAVGSKVRGGRNVVVATLSNSNGAHKKIVAIDVAKKKQVTLVDGDELWHPCLWIKSADSSSPILDLDSAGIYLKEFYENEQALYRHKLGIFWNKLEETEVLLVGSSRTEWGVNPDLYPEMKMVNVGVSGIDASRDLYFVRNYALNHAGHLKAITMSLDLDNWRGFEDHLSLVLDGGPGYAYDANHGFWADSIPEGFLQAVENGYPADGFFTQKYTEIGGQCRETLSWTSSPIEVVFDSVFSEKEMKYLDDRLNELAELAEIAAEKKVYLVAIVFPQAPQYKKTGSFGVYGLQRSVAERKLEWLDSLARKNPYFVLMDENKMGNHDYSDAMAYNRDHLSCEGAEQLTGRLKKLLKELLKN